MPKYDITALERFLVETRYLEVEAPNELEAVRLCRNGVIPYDSHEIVEGNDQWVDVLHLAESEETV